MFDIVFPDGSKCFCTRVYLKQSPLNEVIEETHDNDQKQPEEQEEENGSISSEISSEENEFESEEEEMKLMMKMGLPTSFSSKSKMGTFRHHKKHKTCPLKIENTCLEKSDENVSKISENETVSSIDAEPLKESYYEKGEPWSDINNSISTDFKNYWERYGENILLHNWTKKYVENMSSMSSIGDNAVIDSSLTDSNSACIEMLNKCDNITSKETGDTNNGTDYSLDNSNMKVQSYDKDSTIKNTDDIYSTNTISEHSQYNKEQIMNEQKSECEISFHSECEPLLHDRTKCINNEGPFSKFNHEELQCSSQLWCKEQWKDAWNYHVECEMNKLYEHFKKYYYTYLGILEEDMTEANLNEITSKLEELKDLKFVICDPLPVSIQRRGYNFYPFIKWWKKHFEKGCNLWRTYIANALGYEESVEQIISKIVIEETAPEISTNQVNKSINEICTDENTVCLTSNELTDKDIDADIRKYYAQRHLLFSLFHEGIKLDKESWYSVTPEKIAEHIAERCCCDIIIDGFCGAGGNAIQFAFTCNHVIAVDWDPAKLELARHNAKIYGVEDRIDFICADFMNICPKLKGDVIFLSPPWGGPEYQKMEGFDVATIQPNIYKLFEICQEVTTNIVIYMPRSTYINQLTSLLNSTDYIEVEQNFLNGRIKALTTYYGSVFSEQYYEN